MQRHFFNSLPMRLDRIIEVTPTQTWFALEAGKRMEDFLEMIATEASPTDPPLP
ncbi:hypothetical protein KJ865_16545 [Myxococcota bacterium]|nr:hypothetical protein [Myxococcota bacterium]